jgi:nicotinate-nucleotide adenylyltransferase
VTAAGAPLIGVFGGTFDPIHYGHLRPALEALEALGLAEVLFVPLARAVHRDQPAAGPRQRLDMVAAAVAGQAGFRCDDRELRRASPSYTLDTLAELRRERPEVRLCLLVGGDAFEDFLTWHRPLDILDLAHLVVLQRPGAGGLRDPELGRLAAGRHLAGPQDLAAHAAGGILRLAVTQLDISATDIRRRVAAGASPRFLLPDPVLEIVAREGLYR